MGGPRPGACERPRRLGDGLDDEVVAGAPAEVAGQHLANLNVRRRRAIPKERAGAHDDPRRAIAALEAVLGPEGLLERMQRLAGRRDSLDRADLVAVGLDRQHEAGADRLAVDEHCAGAAHAVLAADVGAGEIQVLTQEVRERRAHVHAAVVLLSVHLQPQWALHPALRQRDSAVASTRSARVAATVLRYPAEAWMSPSGESAAAAALAASVTRAAVGCWPMRAASPGALLTGVPPTPKKPSRACDTAPAPSSQSRSAGSSEAGSAWTRLPTTVPRFLIGACATQRSASAKSGEWVAAHFSRARWRTSAPTVSVPPDSASPSRSLQPLMSTSADGRASRSASMGMRLWPPARTLASSP